MQYPEVPGQVTDTQIKRGYWWLTHRDQVKKISTVILGVVAVAFFLYGTWGFVDWYFVSGVGERAGIAALTKNVINFGAFREANAPQSFVVSPVTVLPEKDSFDAIATVSNPSLKWWAMFQYRFVGAGLESAKPQTSFILPGETKAIAALGITGGAGSTPTVEITNMQWYRVNNHFVQPDYATWAKTRLNFSTTNVTFVAPRPSDAVQASRATFTVQNDSAYGYYATGFFVTAYAGTQPVAVNAIVVSDLRPGDVRQVEVAWFAPIAGVTRVDVQPTVNIFDPGVYIPPGK